MRKPDLAIVVGARPNFVKAAPLISALQQISISYRLINTGQHFDFRLTKKIWADLNLPDPDVQLGVDQETFSLSGAQAKLEADFSQFRPRAVVLFGDVSSTLAGALAAAHCGIPIIHVEAGLRSGESSLPEEINRILVDRLSSILCCPSHDAITNLYLEGRSKSEVFLTGNIMIDSLVQYLPSAIALETHETFGLEVNEFALATLHRKELRTNPTTLSQVLTALNKLNEDLPVLMPLHPSMEAAVKNGLVNVEFRLVPAQGYLQFLNLLHGCKLVVTDSGGVQEEASFLAKPCVTARHSTDRPITLMLGTNQLGGTSTDTILAAVSDQLSEPLDVRPIPFWDGHTAYRIVNLIRNFLREKA